MIHQSAFEIGIGYVTLNKKFDSYFPISFISSHKVIIGHKDDLPTPYSIYKDKDGEYILVNNGEIKIHSKNKKFCV